jgi:RNA recognition motif-containing protein
MSEVAQNNGAAAAEAQAAPVDDSLKVSKIQADFGRQVIFFEIDFYAFLPILSLLVSRSSLATSLSLLPKRSSRVCLLKRVLCECELCLNPGEIFTDDGLFHVLYSQQAQIIKRGTRSLGYGFVTYQTEAEAQKAVQLLNKKEIAGREINVEGAKPQSDLAKHNDSGNFTLAEGEEAGEGKDGAVRGGRGRGRARGKGARGRGGVSEPLTSRDMWRYDGEADVTPFFTYSGYLPKTTH